MRLTEKVRLELEQLIQTGDLCVDATAGNGHDTLAMAQLVGDAGKVIAIDIQAAAIKSAQNRIDQAGLSRCCEFRKGDHAQVLSDLVANNRGMVRAITFNLGYLPGSDKVHITQPETTSQAIKSSLELLKTGGGLFVLAYRGHEGGQQEAVSVEEKMTALPSDTWLIEKHEPSLAGNKTVPPILWIARKRA